MLLRNIFAGRKNLLPVQNMTTTMVLFMYLVPFLKGKFSFTLPFSIFTDQLLPGNSITDEYEQWLSEQLITQ